jgi:hypothetical protein
LSRRTFDDWLQELKEIVQDQFEVELESLPEFDRADARAYYKERSSPSLYFKECLSEHSDSDISLKEMLG